MQSLDVTTGQVLVAKPMENEPLFNRSVILITNHNSTEGTVGFIINKATGFVISDFIPETHCDFNIYNGGPVDQKSLYFLHCRPDLIANSIKITKGIYWGGSFDDVKKILANQKIPCNQIKFFLGYSGWSPKQLEKEIKLNSWKIQGIEFDLFEKWNHDLWQNYLKKMGGENLLWIHTPHKISLN